MRGMSNTVLIGMTGKFNRENFKSPLLHLGMENFNCTLLQTLFYNLQIFRLGRFYNENFKQPSGKFYRENFKSGNFEGGTFYKENFKDIFMEWKILNI